MHKDIDAVVIAVGGRSFADHHAPAHAVAGRAGGLVQPNVALERIGQVSAVRRRIPLILGDLSLGGEGEVEQFYDGPNRGGLDAGRSQFGAPERVGRDNLGHQAP
ncbi:MAG: hypothetical protein IH786_12910, partial [Proteobacteria bacterium]|nr:hypothetical protein [Pseudomonadota bacterium]